ncbi:MAG TPA: dUTP diphosphatase [Eubacteriaceae bacterium]|nr:dUTP diphosphatase [Eubacteriaceae bacterium]
MEQTSIEIVNDSAYDLPSYKTSGSAGVDLRANLSDEATLRPFERLLVPTGIFLALPEGIEAQIRARSGISSKYGITLVNGVGTIDSDYRGEIKVALINLGQSDYTIQPGDRIAQMIFSRFVQGRFVEVETLDETARNSGGFGHTGTK